jgi:hypothetical protein
MLHKETPVNRQKAISAPAHCPLENPGCCRETGGVLKKQVVCKSHGGVAGIRGATVRPDFF